MTVIGGHVTKRVKSTGKVYKAIILGCTSGVNDKQGKTNKNGLVQLIRKTHTIGTSGTAGDPSSVAEDGSLNCKTKSTVRVSVTKDKLEGAFKTGR